VQNELQTGINFLKKLTLKNTLTILQELVSKHIDIFGAPIIDTRKT